MRVWVCVSNVFVAFLRPTALPSVGESVSGRRVRVFACLDVRVGSGGVLSTHCECLGIDTIIIGHNQQHTASSQQQQQLQRCSRTRQISKFATCQLINPERASHEAKKSPAASSGTHTTPKHIPVSESAKMNPRDRKQLRGGKTTVTRLLAAGNIFQY